ncbi:MAG: TIGR03663 family protein, partial [Ignavibacteriae bacterium]|nr:TIGR03663 family protein [Ignavibacteriota bacterium]
KILKLNNSFIFVIVIFFALFLRTFQLDNRPLHTDEAVHAVKFGELLEEGSYIYDPIEYHGPTLNYFTLVSTSLFGEETLKDINEITIRLVPAIISLLLIASLFLMYQKNNFGLVVLIAFLLTISPVLQFYSRYYIQEVLLVAFSYSTILTFYKFFGTKKILWLVISGALVGLIFATKETSIITFFAATTAIITLSIFYKGFWKKILVIKSHLILFVIVSSFVSILFYSSFFSNLQGIIDSVLTYGNYFSKAGNNIEHTQPWYYYIQLMFLSKTSLIFYSGIPIFVFSIAGIYFSFLHKTEVKNIFFFRFITIFSFTQATVYSFISYKTPWLVLNFWVGILFLSGFGIYQTYKIINQKYYKVIFPLLVILIFSHNIYQTYVTSFKYPYQHENPFTYSQATPEIISVAEMVMSIAEVNKDGKEVPIYIIAKDNDYWPLPWYLRTMKNVAWNNQVQNSVYQFPIIIASPEFEEEIIEKLFSIPPPGKKNLYVPLFDEYFSLRPNIEIRGYVQKDYYDLYLRLLDKESILKNPQSIDDK